VSMGNPMKSQQAITRYSILDTMTSSCCAILAWTPVTMEARQLKLKIYCKL